MDTSEEAILALARHIDRLNMEVVELQHALHLLTSALLDGALD